MSIKILDVTECCRPAYGIDNLSTSRIAFEVDGAIHNIILTHRKDVHEDEFNDLVIKHLLSDHKKVTEARKILADIQDEESTNLVLYELNNLFGII